MRIPRGLKGKAAGAYERLKHGRLHQTFTTRESAEEYAADLRKEGIKASARKTMIGRDMVTGPKEVWGVFTKH